MCTAALITTVRGYFPLAKIAKKSHCCLRLVGVWAFSIHRTDQLSYIIFKPEK